MALGDPGDCRSGAGEWLPLDPIVRTPFTLTAGVVDVGTRIHCRDFRTMVSVG